MLVAESYVNDTKGHIFGETPIYDTYTDDLGRLFRDFRSEYGACIGHVYMDTKSRGTVACGWVFAKTMQYEDCEDTYRRVVWVTFYDDKHGRVLDLARAQKAQRTRKRRRLASTAGKLQKAA